MSGCVERWEDNGPRASHGGSCRPCGVMGTTAAPGQTLRQLEVQAQRKGLRSWEMLAWQGPPLLSPLAPCSACLSGKHARSLC